MLAPTGRALHTDQPDTVGGRIVRHARSDIVRVLDGWPDARAITGAHHRIATLT